MSRITKESAGDLSANGSKLSALRLDKNARGAKDRNSKRNKEHEQAIKDKIYAHLDLTKPLEESQKGKLLKNLELAMAASRSLGAVRSAAAMQKKREAEEVPSLRELLTMKEKEVNPLTYNCDFARLT